MQATKAGNWPVNGPFYIEEVFSTWLYTGTGSNVAINNGIDLSGKGGLVWMKNRTNVQLHSLCDTVTGAQKYLNSASTAAQSSGSTFLQSFTSTGFNTGSTFSASADNYVSWTFREQPKFFDVVTWTGDGATSRTISHNLGSAPGVLILKNVSNSSSWSVFHRSLGVSQTLLLENTTGSFGASGRFGSSAPTSTTFDINDIYNTNGETYVAYLFAHNAGGFGLTGTDNVISCGSFTTDGSGNATVNLGYEPQWFLVKRSSGVDSWYLVDNMRGFTMSADAALQPNSSAQEVSLSGFGYPTATGWSNVGDNAQFFTSSTYIYIAIRRGPMKVPTTGTSVFSPNVTASQPSTLTSPPASDLVITRIRESDNPTWNSGFIDRLRGNNINLVSSSTDAEVNQGSGIASFTSSQAFVGGISASSMVWYLLKRAPSFFDEVCYTGTGGVQTLAHNLNVVPELMITKRRDSASLGNWYTYSASLATSIALFLNDDGQGGSSVNFWNNTRPTATQFTIGSNCGQAGSPYVNYLFATCPGVSKVGSYTGTGTTQTINCGFTGGARFVLIKRTDNTGDWYVWDSARGIVAGNDPYLLLNSTAAEVTNTDFVDTAATGFEISSTAPAAINANGGTYIFLAIA
jgi:hypothetical protein